MTHNTRHKGQKGEPFNSLRLHFLVFCALLCLQGIAQQPVDSVMRHNLTSMATGQDYELFVSLPRGYATEGKLKYPVLYVLDGNFMFPVMAAYQRLLSAVGEVRDMIIVGVGYHTNSIFESTRFRTPDYTPTKDTAFERSVSWQMNMEVRSGGAKAFLTALKTEIFPFIETRYRTDERGLAGHSFGGLFGTYALLQEPALFSKYLLSSSSLFWDGETVLKQAQAFSQRPGRTIDVKLFVTVGEQETFMEMIPLMKKLVSSLKAHEYKGLSIEERVLPNETHGSAFLTAFNQGLRALYASH